MPRSDLKLRIVPKQLVHQARWLSPDRSPIELELTRESNALQISLPTLRAYGIVRLKYA
jgi:hypothetical protein